uniref:Uncharacterized protein n=1 Tax=Ganoderma boninense TaxID=34458 RepID=A0A5K1JVS4_9APHY|nr:Uncharacterized protein [Ganoderma boninense]
MPYISGRDLFLHTILLRPLDDLSLWATLLIWAVRILTISLLFRTYIGPAVVRLVSNRLRIRSISLRSIRGVYFKAGNGTWRVDRIGISYHRPSSGYATRFSFQVQGLSLELDGGSATNGAARPKVPKSRPAPSRVARRVWKIILLVFSSVYTSLEPHFRPRVRAFFVTLLRLAIRALPTLTNGVDFELDQATVFHSSISGVRVSVGQAKLQAAVSLAYLPSVVSADSAKIPNGHRRFQSVADWNARLKGSVRRTWDRAWGATQVAASITLQVNAISGHADKTSEIYAGAHRGPYFLDVPAVLFSISGRLNPHHGVEPRSVEMSLDLGKINAQADVLQSFLKTVKQRREAQETRSEDVSQETSPVEPSPMPSSAASHISSAQPTGWKSPLSPSSPFMGALSAPSGISASVLYATTEDVTLHAGLSNPVRCGIHKNWLGTNIAASVDCAPDSYSVVLEAKKIALDRNGIGELVDHLQIVVLNSFKWDSFVSQWPAPWVAPGPAFLAGDPNAHLLVSNVTLSSVELTERLDILEDYKRKESSIEKTVGHQPLLPPMLSPVPRVSFGIHVGVLSLRLISPTSQREQEPFVMEARTDDIVASLASNFAVRPDRRYGAADRDFAGLDMEFQYSLNMNRPYAKIWFGPDAHMRGVHPEDFRAPSYPSEPLVQVESVHLGGTGHGLGEFVDEASGIVSVDVSSIYTQCQLATDAISVELWQPEVIGSLAFILSRIASQSKPKPPKPSRRVLDQLPFGVDASLAIGRFIMFSTSPDLAPGDTLNISRGIASRTGISVTYSALQKSHCSRMSSIISRSHHRTALLLPKEQVLDVVHEQNKPGSHQVTRALIQVSFWDIVVRDAFATPFAADDPYGLDDQSVHHRSLEFLHIDNCDIHVVVSGQRPHGAPPPHSMDDCHVEVSIPKVRAKMDLCQIYHALLAVHTVQQLVPSRPGPPSVTPRAPSPLRLHLRFQLQQMQLLWRFPLSSKMFLRLSSLSCHIAPDRKISVAWDSILTGVNVLVYRDGQEKEEWEELARLPRWRVDLDPSVKPLSIRVKGDSGRLRIPFDFVFADLILDINLTVKSAKHLVRMVHTGKYEDPLPPPAEDAKHVPDIQIELGRLIVEAADDEHEARLGLIWKTGFSAAKLRREREEAFKAKVDTIISPKHSSTSSLRNDSDFQFTSKHTVSITDARSRLDQVHGGAWKTALDQELSKQTQREELHWRNPMGSLHLSTTVDDMVHINNVPPVPPLVRFSFNQLSLVIAPPSFPYSSIPDYLYEAGQGLPRDTQFSLLVPMHIRFTVSSLRLAFRSYPLPLLHIPPHSNGKIPALVFDTDLVVAEEMGTDSSVEWVPCEIVKEHSGLHGAAPISVNIPKTIMPVKTYARPTVLVKTDGITDFSWGVSFQPATQDLMRVIDMLSHAPRDSSPAIGFWDKLRLVFHWRLKVQFKGEVHFHLKGSRDPYKLDGHGAGFALCWKGKPQLLVGQPNDASELVQVISDSMLIIIPNIEDTYGDEANKPSAKGGRPFDRSCRHFEFKPHYDVRLELKDQEPAIKGDLYPRKRPISPKFGQHLSTLKYLISVPQLYISHVYVDESQDAWADGVTPFVGVKALIGEFRADMHQRDTATTEFTDGGKKTVHSKPFYAIEVVLKSLDLRAMLAVFSDPLKQCTPVEYSPFVNNYRTRNELPSIPLHSSWVDMDDFIFDETEGTTLPEVHLLPAVSCPRFTYFKQCDDDVDRKDMPATHSKFGAEDTHVCFIGKEPSVAQVQMDLVSERIDRLREMVREDVDDVDDSASTHSYGDQSNEDGDAKQNRTRHDLSRMIALLESYKLQLRNIDKASQATKARNRNSSYYMPTDLVTPEEWSGFDNVYQVHSPHIVMDNAIRDILMQYYYCSRSRRGFEYHLAQRAVKFIRDQAQAALTEFQHETEKHAGPAASAHAAAARLKTFLTGESNVPAPVEFTPQTVSKLAPTVDPLYGWAEGVSARKGHFCLLLKPQVVLRSNDDQESVCILAAVQGKLKTFTIMDDANVNDPISGKVMNRNFAWLTGLQTFSPSATNTFGKDSVPLEVLIDLRADNSDFDRLVPQTDATFQYDKFNRLRLRNDTTAVSRSVNQKHAHLQNQTDLIRVHVPRFTVSANDRHFQAISNIVTKLVLFTDAAHKTRAEKLESLLFSYDFTNFASAADVVSGMQDRLRQALETKSDAERKLRGLGNPGRVELLKIDAHILLLVEELNMMFDAIKLSQDKANSESDQKSALLLHTSSEEVSWRMLDQRDQLLAKVAVRVTDFYWLSRHDSSTVNNLAVGDLQAFDGAADAEWTEILSKYDEPSTHPLVKRKLFLLAHWTVLPPVGGITIYEEFELSFHPMRLQIDTRVGRKIMCYVWPARRDRTQSPTELAPFLIPEPISDDGHDQGSKSSGLPAVTYTDSPRHASFDVSPARRSLDMNRLAPPSPLRRLGTSRSFTDLRKERQDSLKIPRIQRTGSSGNLRDVHGMTKAVSMSSRPTPKDLLRNQQTDDALEMKTRASQKTFVKVKVASLHLLLSISKEDSFLCRDARIRTRDLEYRNQTWSFEELVDQFIPSGRNWRGWVKVAFQQPLVPVFPVARELITKTKWIATNRKDTHHNDRPTRPSTPKLLKTARPPPSGDPPRRSTEMPRKSKDKDTSATILTEAAFMTSEPQLMREGTIQPKRDGVRKRAMSLFRRKHRHGHHESSDTLEGSDSISSHPHLLPSLPLMPSVRVKKGYRNLDSFSNDGQSRSRALSAPQAHLPQEFEMAATPQPPGRSWSSGTDNRLPSRPRAPSKISSHILSRRRPSATSIPESPAAGPSHLAHSSAHRHPHYLLRRHHDVYVAEGQQADLRVPNNGCGDIAGSHINLALQHLEGEDFDRPDSEDEHHHDDIVEHLDVIDPQISTVCDLTNAANAIVVPPLSFYSRKPVVVLPQPTKKNKKQVDAEKGSGDAPENLSEDALDQHVQDVLSKRAKFRRMMAGVWSFLKTPLGIATAIYGFLVATHIVFWGTAIVVFLIPIINLHNELQQGYWVELSQQVETGLFTITSIGFIPFRVMDTYRICKIWCYKRKIARVRRKAGLLELYDPDDLPDPVYDKTHVQVLSEKEQIDLHYQQHQFMKSQTWYRPHGTQTHRAFPITMALWICICNDLNSFFQCLLSGTMWGLDRFERPAWTTATTLPAAFVAGIIAGVLIYLGGRKTRRTKQVEDRLRLALEMEGDISKAKRTDSDTPTAVGVAVETPLGPTDLLTVEMPSKITSASQSENNLAPGPIDITDAGRTGPIPEEPSQPAGRKKSGASLRFADEIIVPPVHSL